MAYYSNTGMTPDYEMSRMQSHIYQQQQQSQQQQHLQYQFQQQAQQIGAPQPHQFQSQVQQRHHVQQQHQHQHQHQQHYNTSHDHEHTQQVLLQQQQPQPQNSISHSFYNLNNGSQGFVYNSTPVLQQVDNVTPVPIPYNDHDNHSKADETHIKDDIYYDMMVAGLPDENSNTSGASEHQADQPVESVDLESLLEDDPLLSFTTTLDRQESNDTILQSSSPILDSIEPMRPIVELDISGNNSQLSLVRPSPETELVTQQSFIPTPASSASGVVQSPSLHHAPPPHQSTFTNYHHNNLSSESIVPPSKNGSTNVSSPHIYSELQHVPVPANLRQQIENQALFQNQQQHRQPTSSHPSQSSQSKQSKQQQQRTPQQGQARYQSVPQFHQYQSLQNIAHPPSVPPPPVPKTSSSPQFEQIKFRTGIHQSTISPKNKLPPTPPASGKEPLIKSSSTTKLNRTKKISSFGAPKMVLKRSESYLSATSAATKKTPFFSTLDFSKSVNANIVNRDNDFSKMTNQSRPTLQVTNSFKNYEFVFEDGSQSARKSSMSTPRRKSSTSLSTPTSAHFQSFAKPPAIDFSFSCSPSSLSPTGSDASSIQSPSGGFGTPTIPSGSRFGSAEVVPNTIFNSSSENLSKRKKNSISGISPTSKGTSPPFHVRDMKAGMIEFRLKNK